MGKHQQSLQSVFLGVIKTYRDWGFYITVEAFVMGGRPVRKARSGSRQLAKTPLTVEEKIAAECGGTAIVGECYNCGRTFNLSDAQLQDFELARCPACTVLIESRRES